MERSSIVVFEGLVLILKKMRDKYGLRTIDDVIKAFEECIEEIKKFQNKDE